MSKWNLYEILSVNENVGMEELDNAYLNFLVRCDTFIRSNISTQQKNLAKLFFLVVTSIYEREREATKYRAVYNTVNEIFSKIDEDKAKRESEELKFEEERIRLISEIEEQQGLELDRLNAIYEVALCQSKKDMVINIIGPMSTGISEERLVEIFDSAVSEFNLTQITMADRQFSTMIQNGPVGEWIPAGECCIIGHGYPLEREK